MKSSVDKNGRDDQHVGKDDNKTHQHAQADNDIITLSPVVANVLAAFLIEKLHRFVIVAGLVVLLHLDRSGSRISEFVGLRVRAAQMMGG